MDANRREFEAEGGTGQGMEEVGQTQGIGQVNPGGIRILEALSKDARHL